MRRYYIILSFAILSLFCLSSYVGHAEAGSYKVGANSLKVRSEPSAEATEVGSLSRDAEVVVLETKHGWAKIEYEGRSNWVASHYLYEASHSPQLSTASTGEASVTSASITVVADGVRLRDHPSTDAPVVGSVSSGDTYEVLDTAGDWKQIRLRNGNTAWVAGWLVSSGDRATSVGKPSANNGSLQGQTIILDAGHGGEDPGAIGIGGVLEKDLNLYTAQRVKNKLQNAGAEVIMTRNSDHYISLQERASLGRAFPSSIFISLHYNSHINSLAHGINTFYYDSSARTLSNSIQGQLARTSLQGKGTHFGDFFVLRNNHQQSVLLELGFVTNHNDLAIIQSESYQDQIADAIVQGLIHYLNT